MKKRAIIIGGGIGGLATAIRLKHRGYSVHLYEKNTELGGKIGEIKEQAFRFDTGPSLFTLPSLTDELFLLCNKNPRDYFSYTKLENTCRYYFSDGTIVNAYSNRQKFGEEIKNVLDEHPSALNNYLDKYHKLYDNASPVFLFNAFQKLKNLTKKKYRKTFFHLHQLDAFTSMHRRNKKSFKSDKLVQMFDRYATYNGSDPYRAPATLNMIAHLEHNLGAYFPEKGMRSIVDALEKLAKEEGVHIYKNCPIDEILYEDHKISGVRYGHQTNLGDHIICDIDVRAVYAHLLPGIRPPKAVINKELSSSALIFYWGLNCQSTLDFHNILFAKDYKSEFQAIFKEQKLYHDPTVYIFISKKIIDDDAPKDGENWFVMINVPPNQNHNWDRLQKEAKKIILDKIKTFLKIDINDLIQSEHVATPQSIENQSSSYKGALYGNSSNTAFSAFNRHANFSSDFKNLWFVGGSVHPGGGIPLCLASAKIVANEIKDSQN